jgi:hypothetical protein
MGRAYSFSQAYGGATAVADARRRVQERAAAAELIGLPAAAELARCSSATVLLAAKRRDVPCKVDKQGRRFFDPELVREWARERRLLLT